MSSQYLGASPSVRFRPSQTVWAGCPVLAARHTFAGELLCDRAFGPFRDGTPRPKRWGNLLREGCHRLGDIAWCDHFPLPAVLSSIAGGHRLGRQRLEPTPYLLWYSDTSDGAHTGLVSGPEVWTVPIEAIGHNRAERQHLSWIEGSHHLRCQRRLGLNIPVPGNRTLGPLGRIRLAAPWVWENTAAYPPRHRHAARQTRQRRPPDNCPPSPGRRSIAGRHRPSPGLFCDTRSHRPSGPHRARPSRQQPTGGRSGAAAPPPIGRRSSRIASRAHSSPRFVRRSVQSMCVRGCSTDQPWSASNAPAARCGRNSP